MTEIYLPGIFGVDFKYISEEYCDYGRYAVGISGAVHSCVKSPFWPELNTHTSSNGYATVTLYKNQVKKTYRVHMLVLTTFIGPCPPGMEARHGVLGKSNNSLANLSWGTKYENNTIDKTRDGTLPIGNDHKDSKLAAFEIPVIRQMYKDGHSQQAIANKYHVNQTIISDIVRYNTWKHIE